MCGCSCFRGRDCHRWWFTYCWIFFTSIIWQQNSHQITKQGSCWSLWFNMSSWSLYLHTDIKANLINFCASVLVCHVQLLLVILTYYRNQLNILHCAIDRKNETKKMDRQELCHLLVRILHNILCLVCSLCWGKCKNSKYDYFYLHPFTRKCFQKLCTIKKWLQSVSQYQ